MNDPIFQSAASALAQQSGATQAQPVAIVEQAPVQTPAQATALNELARMKADPVIASKLASGDPVTLASYRAWSSAAFSNGPLPYQPATPPASVQQPAQLAGDQQNELDAALTAVPASPDAYHFTHMGVLEVDHALENEFKQVAHAAALPQHVASTLVTIWNAALRNPIPDPASIEAAALSNFKTLSDALGEEGAREQIRLAKSVIAGLPDAQREWVLDVMASTGLGNDVQVIRVLADHARAVAARRR